MLVNIYFKHGGYSSFNVPAVSNQLIQKGKQHRDLILVGRVRLQNASHPPNVCLL